MGPVTAEKGAVSWKRPFARLGGILKSLLLPPKAREEAEALQESEEGFRIPLAPAKPPMRHEAFYGPSRGIFAADDLVGKWAPVGRRCQVIRIDSNRRDEEPPAQKVEALLAASKAPEETPPPLDDKTWLAVFGFNRLSEELAAQEIEPEMAAEPVKADQEIGPETAAETVKAAQPDAQIPVSIREAMAAEILKAESDSPDSPEAAGGSIAFWREGILKSALSPQGAFAPAHMDTAPRMESDL